MPSFQKAAAAPAVKQEDSSQLLSVGISRENQKMLVAALLSQKEDREREKSQSPIASVAVRKRDGADDEAISSTGPVA